MADGSVRDADGPETSAKPVPTMLLGREHVLDFILPTDLWGTDHAREVSVHLMRVANSTLRMACREEDETDPPGSLLQALEGVSVLLQLAIGAAEAADAGEREVRHG